MQCYRQTIELIPSKEPSIKRFRWGDFDDPHSLTVWPCKFRWENLDHFIANGQICSTFLYPHGFERYWFNLILTSQQHFFFNQRTRDSVFFRENKYCEITLGVTIKNCEINCFSCLIGEDWKTQKERGYALVTLARLILISSQNISAVPLHCIWPDKSAISFVAATSLPKLAGCHRSYERATQP